MRISDWSSDVCSSDLSSNTDLTFDAVDAIVAAGLPRPLLVAEIDPLLPWLGGTAAVPLDFFDIVVAPPAPYPKLFALPRQPVGDAEHAIGLYASALVRDGGTLRSEEHTSELQSLMRISYAVF